MNDITLSADLKLYSLSHIIKEKGYYCNIPFLLGFISLSPATHLIEKDCKNVPSLL